MRIKQELNRQNIFKHFREKQQTVVIKDQQFEINFSLLILLECYAV